MYFTAGSSAGSSARDAPATVEAVPRHRAAVARERVVDREARLDERGAALGGLALAVGEEPQRRREDAGERRVDRHGRLERLHVVRRDADESVALLDRLLHEAELAVLEVADAAVDHVRGGRGGAGHEVVALDEHDVDALEREIAERGDAVDAAADDDDLGRRAGPEVGDLSGAASAASPCSDRCGSWVRRHRCPLVRYGPARGRLAPAGRMWMNTS